MMIEATLCFLVWGNPPEKLLLGYKKVGFGKGKYGGVGGKIERGECAVCAAAREVYEETGIRVREVDLRQMGHLTFVFPYKPEWSHLVYVFVADKWDGQPAESREIKPTWVPVDAIPYQAMWDDCHYWLAHILDGKPVKARFTFKADNDTVDTAQVDPWNGADKLTYEIVKPESF